LNDQEVDGDIIKVDLKEVEWGAMDWIDLA
jgi:hypothetical protein